LDVSWREAGVGAVFREAGIELFCVQFFCNYSEFWFVGNIDRAGSDSKIPDKPKILVCKKLELNALFFGLKLFLE
jgi:hypothetical protein